MKAASSLTGLSFSHFSNYRSERLPSNEVASEAARVTKSINRPVAANADTPYGEVAQYFWQRLSIDIQRAGHLAFARRVTTPAGLQGDWMGWVVEGATGLEEAGG